MCLSCGCGDWPDCHHDIRHITTVNLVSAADAAGIPVEQAASNLVASVRGMMAAGDAMKADVDMADVDMAEMRVVKAAEERRFTLGVAYPAWRADVGRAADGFRDFVSEEVLEKTAWDWLIKHRDVNLFHQDNTLGHFVPTESYIWRADDWVIESPVDGKPYTVRKGDWLLGGVWDSTGWDFVKNRLVNGWSTEGGARRSVPSPERLSRLR
jgi:hypothetical protein